MKKVKTTFRQKVGSIVRAEGGKSQTKMGDAMQIQKAFFLKCAKDPAFLAKGLTLANSEIERASNKRRAREGRSKAGK